MASNARTAHLTESSDAGDARGRSFSAGGLLRGRLAKVEEARLATIMPGRFAGNHCHAVRREAIRALYCSNGPYEEENPDAIPRLVTKKR
jgi:hypothetical protein